MTQPLFARLQRVIPALFQYVCAAWQSEREKRKGWELQGVCITVAFKQAQKTQCQIQGLELILQGGRKQFFNLPSVADTTSTFPFPSSHVTVSSVYYFSATYDTYYNLWQSLYFVTSCAAEVQSEPNQHQTQPDSIRTLPVTCKAIFAHLCQAIFSCSALKEQQRTTLVLPTSTLHRSRQQHGMHC